MKKVKPFNLYYLNLSKVYEISMMINNTVLTTLNRTTESSQNENISSEINLDFGLGNKKFLSDITSGLSLKKEKERTQTTKVDQSFEVKTTKSTLLGQVLSKVKTIEKIESLDEGDLIKIDKINLSLFDSDNTRATHFFKKDIFKGMEVEGLRGFDVNNLISVMFQDQAFILQSEVEKEKIAFKIPQSIENEFENQYRLDDILFSKVSIIGIYKGKLPVEAIKSNTFQYFSKKGDGSKVEIGKEINNETIGDSENYHFLDIIAITQDLIFDNTEEPLEWWQIRKKFLNFLKLAFAKINQI